MTNPQDLTTKLFLLYNEDSTKRIADNTLVALIIMIAESRTDGKGAIIKVIVNLIILIFPHYNRK